MITFGTDGWRAVIGEEYTFENVKILTQAVADYLGKQPGSRKRVVIGYDRRFMSQDFAHTAAGVFAGNGITVVVSATDVPTPVVSFECRYNVFNIGVMITASHNPARFNGYKLKTSEGGSADRGVTDAVEKLIGKSKVKEMDWNAAVKKGIVAIQDLTLGYVDFFKKYVDLRKVRGSHLRVLVDTMHGAGSNYVQRVLGSCGVAIEYIHNDYNPGFEGVSPEPVASNLTELIRRVRKEKYDMGVCLDGDADRLAMIDSQGNFISAQILLPLLAIHMIKNRQEQGGIGKTVVGSNAIDAVALDLGVPCFETAVGFKYISNLFKENVIALGGEEAGGIGYNGYIPERDGSMSFLLILEMMAYEKKSFDQLLAEFYGTYGRWWYERTSVPVKSLSKKVQDIKPPVTLLGQPVVGVNTVDGLKLITKDAWLMFRASGTEPIVRIYVESKQKSKSARLLEVGKKMVYAL